MQRGILDRKAIRLSVRQAREVWLSYKSRLLSKKVCYKVSLCEKCQRQSYKAFTGLSNRAQLVGSAAA